MAEPIDLPFGMWTWVGRRKHKFNRIRQVVQRAVMGGRIGATRKIRLNRPCGGNVALCHYFDHLLNFESVLALL